MFEYYELIVKHYMTDGEGKRFPVEDPIIVTLASDRKNNSSPFVINRLFDEAKSYVLARIGG